MQRIFIDNHDRILYYSNPAGYIAGKEAVVDTMFQTQELERFLQKQSLTIRWEDGVYDRLLLGQRGGRFDPEAPPLKSCRVWHDRSLDGKNASPVANVTSGSGKKFTSIYILFSALTDKNLDHCASTEYKKTF